MAKQSKFIVFLAQVSEEKLVEGPPEIVGTQIGEVVAVWDSEYDVVEVNAYVGIISKVVEISSDSVILVALLVVCIIVLIVETGATFFFFNL